MHLKTTLFTGLLFCFTLTLFSQELYMPRNIKAAYVNKTRDTSGKPGDNYWQNHGDYTIKLRVNPPNRQVYGSERIVYTNNSPDTLKKLNFKLIVNHHKPGAPRAYPVSEDYLTTGLHIDKFVENGVSSNWKESPMDGTDKFVKLKQALLPGKTVKLDIDWHYELSKKGSREGVIQKNTFFIAYFYPRIAVYDDYVGWDRMPHTIAQEFYNDFNDYHVEVSVPKNYIVWATGELQNPSEVLQPDYVQKLKDSKTSEEVIHIATPEELQAGKLTKQSATNIWKFKADDITDMALAVSNEYNWDAGSVAVGDDRRVSVQAAYNEEATDFEHMVDFAKHSIRWLSENLPGIPYPYPKMTVVRGTADMEYPMMANDNSHPENLDFTRFVVEHEIAHTYFPFYTGTNETRYGFMDEGWATTFEYLISIADLGKEQATKNYKRFRVAHWIKDPNFSEDLPIIIPTYLLKGAAMGNNEYGKASLGYLALRDMLGKKKFKSVLQGYIQRWKGHHPMPWDFFYTVNDLTGKNLNWFWSRWFFSNHYIDYRIKNVRLSGKNGSVKIENVGGFPTPLNIVVTTTNGQTKRFHQTPEIWKDGDTVVVKFKNVKDVKSVAIENGIFMDATPTDNIWENQE